MRRTRLLLSVLAARMAASQLLPYNPVQIFLAPDAPFAYIFQPSSQSAGQSELLTINLSASFSASQPTYTTVSNAFPFLQDDVLVPYTPAIDSHGDMTVTSGNCSAGANETQVWSWSTTSNAGSGIWTQRQTSNQEQITQTSVGGSNFLAKGVALSKVVNGMDVNSTIFMFGGMCPWTNSTPDAWTSSADYSNSVIVLVQESAQDAKYDISIVTNSGPPIAEAGFSVTPLPPSYSVDSTGTSQNQQQDFVMLGGHTQSAFINMSQLALYSLPQETWTFLPVSQPSSTDPDLVTTQSLVQVEPRSGHTAVLSEDRSSIIVFGGWVGDITNPAQPQLAILQSNAGYGGWTWDIPTPSGSALAIGAGIYGHGAVMLSGGVMMVLGGYSIPASSSSKAKRGTINSQMYLYNTTSNSWIDSYTPPKTSSAKASSGPLATKSQKAGLGAGLGIGAAILVALVAFYIWYSRRVKRARESRERALLSRSSDGSYTQADLPFLADGVPPGSNQGDATALRRSWNIWDDRENGHDGQYAQAPQMEQQPAGAAGATGLFLDIPSPTRGLRKGLASRPLHQYHAAPRFEDGRLSRGSANIHPIAEIENEDGVESTTAADESELLSDAERKLKHLEMVLSSPADPFFDEQPNPLGSHPVSPEMDPSLRRVPTGASRMSTSVRRKSIPFRDESPNWVVEAGSDDYQGQDGRVSPTKSDNRTLSTLSDRSQRSVVSDSSITRTMSTRTGALLAAALASRTMSSPDHSASSTSGDSRANTMSSSGRRSPFFMSTRGWSSTNGSVTVVAPNSAGSDGESFRTARTNFAHLQSEGEALLGGRREMDRDDPYQRAMAAHSSTTGTAPSLTYDSGASMLSSMSSASRRRPGLMGSLRRALNVVSSGERSVSLTSKVNEPYLDEQDTAASSPLKEKRNPLGGAPRRAVSDGGALLRLKRGRQDWTREHPHHPLYRDDPDAGDWGISRGPMDKRDAEEEWDVEGAAENRDVQVMFTVPKARLRVVNADMDRASVRSASDGALSRAGSLHGPGVTRELSIKELRARAETDRLLLDMTAEEDEEKHKAS